MRVLVTGGCGFLGSAFARRAGEYGHDVTTLDRNPDADIAADIGDPAAVTDAIRATRPDAVIHLAAMLTDAAASDPVAATRVNALGTAALFAACVAQGTGRVIYASSNAAVGPCPDGSGDGVKLAPRTIYGVTKAFGEHLAQAMSEAGSTSFLALRFGWVYGPGRVRGWRVAQDIVERFARGEDPVTYPDMPETMDWTYVDDAAEVLVRALDCPLASDRPDWNQSGRESAGQGLASDRPDRNQSGRESAGQSCLDRFACYNVVGDRRPISDAIAHLQRRFPGATVIPEPVRAPPSGWGLRNDGLAALIGFVPRTRLEDGLDRLLAAIAGA